MIRTKNLTERAACNYCRETGYVIAEGPAGDYDCAYAPCPFCEIGYREEFPDLTEKKAHKIRPPWDPEKGYWQGRSISYLEPECRGSSYSLPPAEQRAQLRAMGEKLGWIVQDVDSQIEPRSRL